MIPFPCRMIVLLTFLLSSSIGYGGSGSRSSPNNGPSGRSWSDRYHGSTFVVMKTHNYYRGGGYGSVYTSTTGSSPLTNEQPKSERPTITTEIVRDAMFIGKDKLPSKDIFNYNERSFLLYDRTPAMEGALSGLKFNLDTDKEMNPAMGKVLKALEKEAMGDDVIQIKDEGKPVMAGSISYFWGDKNLPKGNNKTNCVEFSPANKHGKFSVCHISTLIRCKKSLSEVLIIGKKRRSVFDPQYTFDMNTPNTVDRKVVVKTVNESTADEFAWFCPPSDTCCEWECCRTEEKEHTEFDPPDESFQMAVHLIIVVTVVAVVVIGICCCYRGMDENEAARTANQLRRNGGRHPMQAERIPLTREFSGDYPKQQRTNPLSVNYGWNLMPSAPPQQ